MEISDANAEMAVLGAMLLGDKSTTLMACEMLTAECFYAIPNQEVFKSLREMAISDLLIDLVTLKDNLARRSKLDSVGGVPYLMDLAATEFTTVNLPHYAKIVLDRYEIRKAYKLCNSIIQDIKTQPSITGTSIVTKLQTEVIALGAQITGSNEAVCDIADAVVAATEYFLNAGNPSFAIVSGISNLDDYCQLYKGETTVLGARPGKGKTALMIQYVLSAAKAGKKVLIASCEMTRGQLAARMALSIAQVNGQKIRQYGIGSLSPMERNSLSDAVKFLSTLPIEIIDRKGQELYATKIAFLTKQRKLSGGVDFLCVDYLQKMDAEPEQKSASREQEVSFACRTITGIATTCDIPVLCLAQINRTGTDEPGLEHLRESGQIEADAYNVLLLHETDAGTDVLPARVKIKIAKQRDGVTGEIFALFNKANQRFARAHT